ncbi:MAG: S8 family serine peptidase, partial [Candidatus Kapabacteria bacterium]|nr:S8 family serine peptidase [Candidatus Kapabacteria bacterium]
VYYIGQLDEKAAFTNSGVKDINNNGRKNDVFGIVAFKIDGGESILQNAPGVIKLKKNEDLWVYYIDEDNDGNIDDESPKFDYKYRFDTFNFYKGEKDIKPLMTLSANINKENKTLIINTNDGSHGSHCAGIAAGNNIYGADGNDGIAPGASVVSLKIGNNTLSGGATTCESMMKAYKYGAKFMKESGFKYGVFSMSYGIGSEEPGRSRIDKFLDKFAIENPKIVVVNSMGNSGPGINSTGTPGGSYGTIAVGAMVSPATLKNLYGSGRKTNWITHFSSRGGETVKPDVIGPGAAASTVPAYSVGEAYWGTSMSAPQVAGACAVLFSKAIDADIKVNGFMIKKAIKYSAIPMKGYTSVDYGNGLVEVNRAWKYLKILSERKEYEKVNAYNITTENTFYKNRKGTAAFWKANGYFPADNEEQKVRFSAIFPDEITAKDKSEFYRIFRFESNADWLKTTKSQTYLRGTQTSEIGLLYNHSKMKKSGIYVGRVSAYARNEEDGGFADFDIQACVIVPYKFNQENNYTLELKNKDLAVGDNERIFVEVPAAATAMNIKLTPAGSKYYDMSFYLFAPDGKRIARSSRGKNDDRKDINMRISGGDLHKGIWEILPYCDYKSSRASAYNLEVSFFGLKSEPDMISKLKIPVGEFPKGKFRLFNEYGMSMKTRFSGSVRGYAKTKSYNQSGSKKFSKSIKVADDISNIKFEIEMSADEYAKFTDLALIIYDASGHAVLSSGMQRKSKSINFRPPHSGSYTFEIVPGFTSEEIMNTKWTFKLVEKYHYIDRINLSFNKNNFKLLPGLWQDFKFNLNSALPVAPDGCRSFGEIKITDLKTGSAVRVIDIKL